MRLTRSVTVLFAAALVVGDGVPRQRQVRWRQGDDGDLRVQLWPIPVRRGLRRADRHAARRQVIRTTREGRDPGTPLRPAPWSTGTSVQGEQMKRFVIAVALA